MATGNEILAYKGDAAAGLASNTGAIGVAGMTNVEPLTQTARDLALASFAKNKIIYEQKIKDRDAAFAMLDDDQLIEENIPEQHRKLIDEKKQAIQDIFFKYSGDIYSDPKRFREFQGAVADAKRHIKQSQKWYLWTKSELEERAKTGNPIDQAAYERHITKQWEKNNQNFWSAPDPYAPISDYDLKVVAAKSVYGPPKQTREGDYNYERTFVDPAKTFDQYKKEWGKKDQNHWFDRYASAFLSNPNAAQDIDRVNRSLGELNSRLGVKPGDLNYVEPLNPEKDRPDQIAAKIALADNPAVIEKRAFANEEITAKERERHNRATEGIQWDQLNWEKDKWTTSQKGSETVKNGAAIFAETKFNELKSLATQPMNDGSVLIVPSDMRKLTVEQRKYLGLFGPDKDGKTYLNPLKVSDGDALQIYPDGKILYLRDAKPVKNGWEGKYDPERNTSLTNIATNRLNEELTASGAKELNSYLAIDTGAGGVQENTSGGGSSSSGSSSTGGLKDSYSAGGKVYSLTDLRGMGYSDEDIRAAAANGTIK